jgi:3-mercaptopyruvate sulfurtransferase SseA
MTNTAALLGGTDGWKNAGYPMEGEYEDIRRDNANKATPKP